MSLSAFETWETVALQTSWDSGVRTVSGVLFRVIDGELYRVHGPLTLAQSALIDRECKRHQRNKRR